MSTSFTFGLLFLVGIILGIVKYGSVASTYQGKPWQLKFIENGIGGDKIMTPLYKKALKTGVIKEA